MKIIATITRIRNPKGIRIPSQTLVDLGVDFELNKPSIDKIAELLESNSINI